MERYTLLGQGFRGSYPYEVGIYCEGLTGPCPRPISLSEGTGHMASGGTFPLAAILEDQWTEHLQICGCLWLRDLAVEEQASGRLFTPDKSLHALPKGTNARQPQCKDGSEF